jgi:hypothetical protein
MEKGTVAVIGTPKTYAIEIAYTHEHGKRECGMCAILVTRGTGRTYSGVAELGNNLALILEHYAYDIHHSVMYSHAKTIAVIVWEMWGNSKSLVEIHEITK